MNSNNKLPIRKVHGKSVSYSAVVVRIKIQKNLISYFTVVIVPKYSLYQPLLHVGSVLCVFLEGLY